MDEPGGGHRPSRLVVAVCLPWLVAPLAGCYRSHERPRPSITGDGFVAIGAGDDHTCAVRDDGAVLCWGFAQHGELGDGTGRAELGCEIRVTEGPSRATAAPALLGSPTAIVAGGGLFTCAGLEDGSAACWGASCRGELGDGSVVPRFVPGPVALLSGVRALGLGLEHACAISDAGVSCWGANGFGQLGLGTTSPRMEPGSTTPVLVGGAPPGARELALGDGHSCVRTDAEVWCWGANGAGQLGDGSTELRSIPRPVVGLPPGRVASLGAGERFTCASIEGHGIWCWGWNERYQLGSGHRCDAPIDECMESEVPLRVPLPEIAGAWEVACGAAFACAWGAPAPHDGILCWGADEVGQLGDGAIGGHRSAPEPVIDAPRSPVAVALGDNHGCAIDGAGAISCWGRNSLGQLGDGTTVDRPRGGRILPAEP